MEYQEELKQLKGNEEQKNEQAALLRQKFFSDIDKLETQYEADEKKKREDAEKKRLEDEKKFREQQNKDAIAGADLELALAEGNADRELSAQLNKLEIQKNIELQNQELTNNEKALINKRYEDDKAKLEEQYRQAKLQKEAQTAEAVGSFLMQGAQAVAGLEDQLAQNKISKINDEEKRKETSLDKQLKKGKITEEEYNKRKQQLEDESAKKTALIKNKQAKIDKASNIAQAVMTTILAVLKSLTGAPWPANLIMAAATGAIGAVNVAKIAATPLPTYSLGGFIKRIWGGVKRMFNVGGIMPGPSHGARYGESGIAMINRQTGQEIGEMEGKEIILTKGVANNPKLRAEASRINVAGGGRSFEAGVNLSASSASNTPGAASTSSDISILSQKLDEQIQATKELRNIVFRGFVVLQDINDANDTLQDIKNDAKL
jgi:chemotaxis protein histidine kinase CheA